MKKNTILIILILITISFTACSKTGEIVDVTKYISTIDEITVDNNVKIVGLGEATHGNSELQTLKLDVFKALVKNNNCRVFAIEGDFGGSEKVNEYIAGGEGTAEMVATEIGFAIYRTEEIAELIQWMRDYNQNVGENQQLKFYGYDMQRYDNNKEILFKYLDKVDINLSQKYLKLLSDLNDETVYDQDKSKVKSALEKIEELIKIMDANKENFIDKTNEKEFEFALQCAQSIKENATLRGTGVSYSNTRDEYMKNKIDWILNYENNELIFITGHNGHIEKSSASTGFMSMGERLANTYGDDYYSIGTDFLESTFNIVTSSGKDKVINIKNINPLTIQFKTLDDNIYFMDFGKAKENPKLEEIINSKISMTNIGAEFNTWQKINKFFYTLKIVPTEAYDSCIILQSINPSTRLDLK